MPHYLKLVIILRFKMV